MNSEKLTENIIHINNVLGTHEDLFKTLLKTINWDNTLAARKTASFGVPYNYSNMIYPFLKFPKTLLEVKLTIDKFLGYESNNCLINYYYETESAMGFHSDNIEMLFPETGIAIVSLGGIRTIRFKNGKEVVDFVLRPGSLFYMNQEVQKYWRHAVLKSKTQDTARISLTFRKIQ